MALSRRPFKFMARHPLQHLPLPGDHAERDHQQRERLSGPPYGGCPEYKVVIPLRRDRLCRIRKAKKAHLRKAGEVVEKA